MLRCCCLPVTKDILGDRSPCVTCVIITLLNRGVCECSCVVQLREREEKKSVGESSVSCSTCTRCGTTSKGLRTLVDRRKLPVPEEQLLESFRIAPLADTVILASSFRAKGAELQVVSCSIAAAESIEYSVRREMPGQPGVPRGRMATSGSAGRGVASPGNGVKIVRK